MVEKNTPILPPMPSLCKGSSLAPILGPHGNSALNLPAMSFPAGSERCADASKSHVSPHSSYALQVAIQTKAPTTHPSPENGVVTLFPRRKAGQTRPGGGRGPVVLTLEMLEQFYGVPLHAAAKKLVRGSFHLSKFMCVRVCCVSWRFKHMLIIKGECLSCERLFFALTFFVFFCKKGICQTAIKKVCRRLGIKKWPYKEMRAPLKDEDSEDKSFKLSGSSSRESDVRHFFSICVASFQTLLPQNIPESSYARRMILPRIPAA
jgi:hypothetical protein